MALLRVRLSLHLASASDWFVALGVFRESPRDHVGEGGAQSLPREAPLTEVRQGVPPLAVRSSFRGCSLELAQD